MVLRLLESFDHYGPSGNINALMQRKWLRVTQETGQSAPGAITIVEGQADGSFAAEVNGGANTVFEYYFSVAEPYPDEVVVGFWFNPGGVGITTTEFVRFQRGDTAGSNHVGIEMLSTGLLRITRAGTGIATGTTVLSAGTWYFIEFKALIANSGGTAEIRLDRNVEATFSGDTQNGGTADISTVLFNGGSFNSLTFDDIYILDSTGTTNNDYLEDGSGNAGGTRIITLYPNGEGNSTELDVVRAAENYLAVAEAAPDDDGTYVEGTSTARDTYVVDNLDVPVSDIYGISNEFIYRKSGAGQKLVSTVLRTGGTDFVSVNENSLAEYAAKTTVYDQNPDTVADWTESDINSLEIGIDVFNPATFLQGTGTIYALAAELGDSTLSGTGTINATGDVV